MKTPHLIAAGLLAAALAPAALAQAPVYTITDLGVLGSGTSSQGFGASPDGRIVTGRSGAGQLGAYSWTQQGGMVALPNLAGRNFSVANDANNAGLVVGTSTTTAFGSSPLPVTWNNGVLSALTLPAGYSAGQANGVNAAGVVAGAVGSGSGQRAALFVGGVGSVISTTTANGSFMTVAFGISDTGLVIGTGIDPNNAAVNVGMLYDSVSGTMTTTGSLPSGNGALNFGASSSGAYVVGSSMFNQGAGTPFVWSPGAGMAAIPLPPATSQASARGVNDQGWVVGTAGGQFAVPFLYADGVTYSLQTLLQDATGWNLDGNTSSSALAIGNDGSIIGTALFNGQVRAYQMTLVPEPGTWALMGAGLAMTLLGARRRRHAAA